MLERHPAIAVHGALIFALSGRPADHRALGGGRRSQASRRRHSPTATRWRPRSPTCARCCAATGWRRCAATPSSPRPASAQPARTAPRCCTSRDCRTCSRATPSGADAEFALRRRDAPRARGSPPAVPVLLAERGIAAIDRDDWVVGRGEHAEQMLAMMQGGQFDDYWTSALVFAFAARVLSQRARRPRPRRYVARAARLRPLLSYALPVVSVQALLEMARAYIALGDHGGARAVLRQADDIFQQRPALACCRRSPTSCAAGSTRSTTRRWGRRR